MGWKKLYYIIYKPYKVLSQFSDEGGNPGLGSIFNLPKDVYPVGRLDLDSEGLLVLTNDKKLNNELLNPKNAHNRVYWVEVEGTPDATAIKKLEDGVEINLKPKRYVTKPALCKIMDAPNLAERNPPVNYKKHPIRSWLELILTEGKNRQVRKMTAAVGHPTLRLVRSAIENLQLYPLQPGEVTQIPEKAIRQKLKLNG
ncbi:MAG: pseudouridine synthase [Cyclobacteriaceae bacterium]